MIRRAAARNGKWNSMQGLSSERCNKRQKIDYKLEDGRYRSSKMWYCRLFSIMMCQHLDAWALPKTSHLRDLFEQEPLNSICNTIITYH